MEIKEENGRKYFEYKGIRYEEFKPNEYVAKDILSKEIIDDIVKDKRYLDTNKDVMYHSDIFDNSWENSFVRKTLNTAFKEKYLDDLELDGEVRCLTLTEVLYLSEDLKSTERYGYWTMTPYGLNSSSSKASVFCARYDGDLDWGCVDNTYGLRPVIKINIDKLEEENNE